MACIHPAQRASETVFYRWTRVEYTRHRPDTAPRQLHSPHANQSFVLSDRLLGIDLTIISAALDRVSDKWLKSNKSKVQGVYLPKKEFDALTTEEFTRIEEKLAHVERRKFVMGTLRKAFEIRGVVVKRNTFLEELELPMGPVEEDAFRARGGAAHGGGRSRRRSVEA